MSQAEDLERLARLLDEGKLTQEEYDAAKKELLGLGEVAPPTHTAPPGWYPSGTEGQEAYWDGQRWTGAARSVTEASPPDSRPKRSGCLIAALVVGGLLVLLIIGAVLAVTLAGNEITETFSEIGSELEDLDEAPSSASASISLDGQGEGDTESFSLSGGSYRIETDVGGDCYYAFSLRDPGDGSRVEDITSMDEAGTTTVSLHGIEPGAYYVQVITGPAPSCPWSQRWAPS